MGRIVKSEWDFGDLFEQAAPARQVLTVAELTANVRRRLEQDFRKIWITGEVTNLRQQPSGHIYFTLKDGHAQLSCVLFRNDPVEHRQLLEDGRKMILRGDLTVYEMRGQYQLHVTAIELQGVGALQAAFEKLKQKLHAEGLFALERKRALPRYPQRLGLVTSPSGAAIRDVLHVLQRRHGALEIVLASCRVQGLGAADEVACAIRLLNQWSAPTAPAGRKIDLILITRGGGSLEDLWAFNEEVVARAIFESAIPVVSAVGHEVDFTISDFVADVRAATPSAAAEIITEALQASRQFVAETCQYLPQLLRRRLEQEATHLERLRQRLTRRDPRRLFNERLQLLDDLHGQLTRAARRAVRNRHVDLQNLRQRLLRLKPTQALAAKRQQIGALERSLNRLVRQQIKTAVQTFSDLATRLRLLGPEGTLARGYSITTDAETGQIIRRASETKPGQRLQSQLQVGKIASRVEAT